MQHCLIIDRRPDYCKILVENKTRVIKYRPLYDLVKQKKIIVDNAPLVRCIGKHRDANGKIKSYVFVDTGRNQKVLDAKTTKKLLSTLVFWCDNLIITSDNRLVQVNVTTGLKPQETTPKTPLASSEPKVKTNSAKSDDATDTQLVDYLKGFKPVRVDNRYSCHCLIDPDIDKIMAYTIKIAARVKRMYSGKYSKSNKGFGCDIDLEIFGNVDRTGSNEQKELDKCIDVGIPGCMLHIDVIKPSKDVQKPPVCKITFMPTTAKAYIELPTRQDEMFSADRIHRKIKRIPTITKLTLRDLVWCRTVQATKMFYKFNANEIMIISSSRLTIAKAYKLLDIQSMFQGQTVSVVDTQGLKGSLVDRAEKVFFNCYNLLINQQKITGIDLSQCQTTQRMFYCAGYKNPENFKNCTEDQFADNIDYIVDTVLNYEKSKHNRHEWLKAKSGKLQRGVSESKHAQLIDEIRKNCVKQNNFYRGGNKDTHAVPVLDIIYECFFGSGTYTDKYR